MVCVPCIAIPIFLVIWRFFIQPLFIKWWQFRNEKKKTTNDEVPQLVKECKNGICTLSWTKNEENKKMD
ncbi:UPF0729 protein CG18508-like [Xylocopa sonorina]|uniref:UPF0729 protein CG18508-like n=1 Tax=Xylocopa sonorina TaxID=1818115 RepID=UPI00403B1453